MQPATRSMQHGAIFAAVAGAVVLAAVAMLNVGAVPPLPAKVVLGVALPAFYGAALCTIAPAPRPGRPGLLPERRSPVPEDEVRVASEAQRVCAWRQMRLAALGVPEDVASVLADDPSFSVHELRRLLGAGCPLRTALRILWPG